MKKYTLFLVILFCAVSSTIIHSSRLPTPRSIDLLTPPATPRNHNLELTLNGTAEEAVKFLNYDQAERDLSMLQADRGLAELLGMSLASSNPQDEVLNNLLSTPTPNSALTAEDSLHQILRATLSDIPEQPNSKNQLNPQGDQNVEDLGALAIQLAETQEALTTATLKKEKERAKRKAAQAKNQKLQNKIKLLESRLKQLAPTAEEFKKIKVQLEALRAATLDDQQKISQEVKKAQEDLRKRLPEQQALIDSERTTESTVNKQLARELALVKSTSDSLKSDLESEKRTTTNLRKQLAAVQQRPTTNHSAQQTKLQEANARLRTELAQAQRENERLTRTGNTNLEEHNKALQEQRAQAERAESAKRIAGEQARRDRESKQEEHRIAVENLNSQLTAANDQIERIRRTATITGTIAALFLVYVHRNDISNGLNTMTNGLRTQYNNILTSAGSTIRSLTEKAQTT